MTRRLARFPIWVAATLALCGCSFVAGRHEDLTVYSPQLTIAAAVHPASPWQLIVAEPRALAPLGSDRMVVMPQPGIIEFYKGVRWRDRSTLILQELLVRAFQGGASWDGVSRPESGIRGDFILQSDLRDFQAEYRFASTPTVVVRIDSQLIDGSTHRIVASRSVAIERPCASSAVGVVFSTFEQAVSEAVAQIADWVGESAAASWRARATGSGAVKNTAGSARGNVPMPQ
jgi:cholesterol transport system auxiliary component